MKKISALLVIVAVFVVLSSSAQACSFEKKELALEPAALVGARMYCLYEAIHAPAFADRLRFEELAEMIGARHVAYTRKYNPREKVGADKVWLLYLAALELERKMELKKEEATKKTDQINRIKKEVRLWASQNKK